MRQDAISTRRWPGIWDNVTLSDLLLLADRYLARYPKPAWTSPADAALRQGATMTDASSLQFLRAGPALAPYEEFEHHLFPSEMAERTAEMGIYLSAGADFGALPASVLSVIAEPVAKQILGSMRMSDERDWSGALDAFARIDQKALRAALAGYK